MTTVHMRLTATKEQAKEPILWRLGRDFDVIVNILKASIDEDFGWALVEVRGPLPEVQRATAWLHTTGIIVDPAERSVFA